MKQRESKSKHGPYFSPHSEICREDMDKSWSPQNSVILSKQQCCLSFTDIPPLASSVFIKSYCKLEPCLHNLISHIFLSILVWRYKMWFSGIEPFKAFLSLLWSALLIWVLYSVCLHHQSETQKSRRLHFPLFLFIYNLFILSFYYFLWQVFRDLIL